MDKTAIKNFAISARRILIESAIEQAGLYGISKDTIANPLQKGPDFEVYETISGSENRIFGSDIKKRANLVKAISEQGFDQVIEETAYTWFNRIIAIRFMEVNNYLPTKVRVLSSETGSTTPDIVSQADSIDLNLSSVEMEKIVSAKKNNNYDEAFRILFVKQCNELNTIFPNLFEKIDDYKELLLKIPYTSDGVVRTLVDTINEDDFNVGKEGQIEIIGWLYQYYISEKHEEVVDPLHGKVVKKEDVPAATQLFTTDWVVRYLIDNSVGRYWVERNPESKLSDELTYFVKPKDGVIKTVDGKIMPQDVTVFDPCVGSGHFLVYAFDVLMKIYVECGFSERDAASEIVKNNLFGLDIDGRAAQLAYFAVMMKARQYDRRFLTRGIQPNVYEIIESNGVDRASIEYFCESNVNLKKDVDAILDTLKDAKEYGSILQMPDVDYEKMNERFNQVDDEINIYKGYLLGDFKALIRPAEIMSGKYAVVATNPPYLNKYDPELKNYILGNYKKYSGDLFSVFIYRNFSYCKDYGYAAFMTPNVWMFISTYEDLRRFIWDYKAINNLVYIAKGSFFKEATVDVCAFVLSNSHSKTMGTYFDLSKYKNDMESQGDAFVVECKDNSSKNRYEREIAFFDAVDGYPVAFSLTEDERECFLNYKRISEFISFKQGIATSDNNRFLRLWHECDYRKIGFGLSKEEAKQTDFKWFPYNKGGNYRKWYGNNEYVINYQYDGAELKAFHEVLNKEHPGGRLKNSEYYFREGVTWSVLTSGSISLRYSPKGQLFDSKGSMGFADNTDNLKYCMGFINSQLCNILLEKIVPTLDFNLIYMNKLPVRIEQSKYDSIVSLVNRCIDIAKKDWDSYETSWDFQRNPLITNTSSMRDAWKKLAEETEENRLRLEKFEGELNQLFVGIYSISDEKIEENATGKIVLREASAKLDVRAFISYAVGCMFGRYSLDVHGIAYAGGDWDESKYKTFRADADAIIPISEDEFFEDDIVGRFVKFVEVVYGKDTLEDNLKFIADALGGNGTSREVIRNYFLNDFYADHVKIYQKRPIYWLFDSGKKNGFKCLIYMHRYQPDIVGRVRSDYLVKIQSLIENALKNTEYIVQSTESIVDKAQAMKKQDRYIKQLAEIKAYYPALSHIALQKIAIDLDDGVKVNYAKFQGVEVVDENGKKQKVDLLAKI